MLCRYFLFIHFLFISTLYSYSHTTTIISVLQVKDSIPINHSHYWNGDKNWLTREYEFSKKMDFPVVANELFSLLRFRGWEATSGVFRIRYDTEDSPFTRIVSQFEEFLVKVHGINSLEYKTLNELPNEIEKLRYTLQFARSNQNLMDRGLSYGLVPVHITCVSKLGTTVDYENVVKSFETSHRKYMVKNILYLLCYFLIWLVSLRCINNNNVPVTICTFVFSTCMVLYIFTTFPIDMTSPSVFIMLNFSAIYSGLALKNKILSSF